MSPSMLSRPAGSRSHPAAWWTPSLGVALSSDSSRPLRRGAAFYLSPIVKSRSRRVEFICRQVHTPLYSVSYSLPSRIPHAGKNGHPLTDDHSQSQSRSGLRTAGGMKPNICAGRNMHCSRVNRMASFRGLASANDGIASLRAICNSLEASFFELCICNSGRPAAVALLDFVTAALDAYRFGYSLHTLTLELSLSASPSLELSGHPLDDIDGGNGSPFSSEFRLDAAGYRLTSSEQQYREQWLQIIYLTLNRLQTLHGTDSSFASPFFPVSTPSRNAEPSVASQPVQNPAGNRGESKPTWMQSVVDRVILGQASGEEQSSVRFDRALETGGEEGGVAAQARVIAPQWVPVSQLVLLTIKVHGDMQTR